MLIKCPECGLQISDKAYSCPHCGYPMKVTKSSNRRYSKRKRLPNGFGQISEIKNRNLRKPFRAMVTIGKSSTGRPIVKPLKPESYFATYNEAYSALVNYNKNPYDLKSTITMQELYEEWSKEHFKKINKSTIDQIERAWKFSYSIYNIPLKELRIRDMKDCIGNAKIVSENDIKTPNIFVKRRMKANFNLLYDYAMDNEYIDVNKARNFQLEENHMPINKNAHISYSDEEMEILWNNLYKIEGVDIVLIQCYSGWRPRELGSILLKDVDLENDIVIGGLKTKAGQNRKVPIHSKIKPLIEKQYTFSKNTGNKYLISCNTTRKRNVSLTYQRYKFILENIVSELELNPDHKPHDGRVQFVTMAKKYGVDEYAIKYMAGHSITDITEQIYTKRDDKWLKEEIEKIR